MPATCAYCRKHPVEPEWRPFCSERCKLLDLSHWIEGTYTVPGGPADAVEADDDEEHGTSG